jgi:hypothetical protein
MKLTPPARPLAAIMDLDTGISMSTTDRLAGFHGLQLTDRAAREEILHRAYAIWEREGCPENRKLDNWLEAETAFLHRP